MYVLNTRRHTVTYTHVHTRLSPLPLSHNLSQFPHLPSKPDTSTGQSLLPAPEVGPQGTHPRTQGPLRRDTRGNRRHHSPVPSEGAGGESGPGPVIRAAADGAPGAWVDVSESVSGYVRRSVGWSVGRFVCVHPSTCVWVCLCLGLSVCRLCIRLSTQTQRFSKPTTIPR